MSKISNPFEIIDTDTEWSAVATVLNDWGNHIIKEKLLNLGPCRVEKKGVDRKRPDGLIYRNPKSKKPVCLIEFKQPFVDVYNEKELINPAWNKARKRHIPYFATCNFKTLILFNTQKVTENQPLEQQIVQKYRLSDLEDIQYIEKLPFSSDIKKNLERFLIDLFEISTGRKPEPRHDIDEFLVLRLQEKIKALATHYEYIVKKRIIDDPEFSKKLQQWFIDQNWNFTFQDSDSRKAARQAAYLLVNKILFYNVLRAKRPQDLDPLEIPENLTKGSLLQSTLQNYFNEVLKIDYETIYTTDFIDEIAFPDIFDVVEEIKELIIVLSRYDFAKLRFDVIGRIFESLIPAEERHVLGQYFTRSDIVDFILRFCLRDEKDKVFDPGCGAGTFLVRAYQHKKIMNQRLDHEEILKTLWGNDIAKFPAHLTTINLAINDLSSDENYPRVIKKDFFELLPGKVEFNLPDKWREVKLEGLGEVHKTIEHPRFFDCVVGNPPYTRQEEISDIEGKSDAEYKANLISNALSDMSGKKIATISKRAGLHAYFFVHGFKFLQNGGRFGFIVSNSWLDVDYGKGLQEFFLKNYKVIAIIESKVERWFAQADVNTCIVILEKCAGEKNRKERDENLCRFVYLKKPLKEFIPPAQDMWEKQVERINKIDDLIKTILAHNKFYKNDDLRIFPKKQKELWEEGFDKEKNKYSGSNWSKYIRAPEIFYKIIQKKNKLKQISKFARIIYGVKTGSNNFFFINKKEKRFGEIEIKFLKRAIINIRGIKTPLLSKSSDYVLDVKLNKTDLKDYKVYQYIRRGEKEVFGKGKKASIPAETKTCRSHRPNWYNLDLSNYPILFPRIMGDRFFALYNPKRYIPSDNFSEILPQKEDITLPLVLILNSTLTILFNEIEGRQLTGALNVLRTDTWRVKKLFTIRPQLLKKFTKKLNSLSGILDEEINHIFIELGADNPQKITFNKIKKRRRMLDKMVMGDILGLTEDEQLDVYKAVIDLVRSRLNRAKSVSKKSKTKEGIDINKLAQTVMKKIGSDTLGKFYKEKILSQKHYTKKLPKKGKNVRIDRTLMEWLLISDKKYIVCTSEEQAEYLKIWLEAGLEEVETPYDDNYLKLIMPELEKLFKRIKKIIDGFVYSIVDQKTRQRILQRLWQEVTEYKN